MVVQELSKRKGVYPKTVQALKNTMNSIFKKQLSEQEIVTILSRLTKKGLVKTEGTIVTYHFHQESIATTQVSQQTQA